MRIGLHLIQAIGIAKVIAILFGFYQYTLVNAKAGIVNDIIRLDDLGLFYAGLHAGGLAVEVRITVAVVLQDLLRANAHAETVKGICADLAGLIGTLHHAVRLVIDVGRNGDVLGAGGRGRANLFFLYQIAALIVGIAIIIDAGEFLLIAAGMLTDHLVEVITLPAILFALGRTALLEQVAQRVIAVGIGKRIVGVDFQFAGAASEPVKCIVGICCAALEVFRRSLSRWNFVSALPSAS